MLRMVKLLARTRTKEKGERRRAEYLHRGTSRTILRRFMRVEFRYPKHGCHQREFSCNKSMPPSYEQAADGGMRVLVDINLGE